jgi:putative ABC transport system permease protein
MDTLWQDLKYAARRLVRSPAFTVVAVLTLALGIGANSAIFSVVNGVLFRSLPFKDPQALVRLGTVDRRQQDQPPSTMSAPDFMSFREESRVFEDVVAYTDGDANLTGLDEPQRLDAAWVSAGFFELLGAQLILGRSLRPEENQTGSARVVVLSHGTWQQMFGGRPDILGETLTLNGLQREVVGGV